MTAPEKKDVEVKPSLTFIVDGKEVDANGKEVKATTAEKAAAEPEADTDEKTAARTSTAKK